MAALEHALGGRGHVLLVAGEPGIGKTRLAEELAARARGLDARVVWGRCWEAGGAPAYWPWVQSLRSLLRGADPIAVRRLLGSAASDVAQILPERRDETAAPDLVASDPEAARFSLFDAVTSVLTGAAAERPLVIVLDDLQVADVPSLLLLRFATAAIAEAPVLIIATYRDTDLTAGHPLAQTLTELGRDPAVRRVHLRGLSAPEVSDFIAATTGTEPDEALARSIHEQTEGNPLFVAEMVRLLADQDRLQQTSVRRLRIPGGVRDVINRRLAPLSTGSITVLSLASVLGRDFSVQVLARLAERTPGDVLGLLDEALQFGVVTDSGTGDGTFRFAHVLIRETLHDAIPRAKRAGLHHAAGRVLEELYAHDIEGHLAELAHHFSEALPEGDPTQAVAYARRAADSAMSLLAYEEAVRLYRSALAALAQQPGDARERSHLLLSLGDAQARSGDEAGWKATLLDAARLARTLGESDLLARIALTYGGRIVWVRAGGDPHLIPLLHEALAAVGESDSPLRARILARLGGALRDDPAREPRESLAREAVAVASRLDDPATLAYSLDGLAAALWRPDANEERLAITERLIQVATAINDLERAVSGHQFRFWILFEMGDLAAASREVDAISRLSHALRQRAHGWMPASVELILALTQGRYAHAEDLIVRARQQREHTNQSDALMGHALHLFQLRRDQGGLEDIEPLVSRAATAYPWYPHLRCALALLHVEAGQEAEARAEFEQLAARDFAAVPFDNKWLYAMALLSEAACVLEDAERAAELYGALRPYAHCIAVAAGDGCAGSVSRLLGMLAAAQARDEDAERHFEDALEQNTRIGARPLVARTQFEYAVMLRRRGAGDEKRTSRLLAAAQTTCRTLGMRALEVRVNVLLEMRDGSPPSVAPAANAAPPVEGRLSLDGEYWTISYEGRVVRLRDSKGLRLLSELLTHPGRPLPALDLERLGAVEGEATARAVAAGDAGELLDAEARAEYRARLAELREEIDEATALGDADRAGARRDEADFIMHELSRALGLGGRARVAGSVAERARLNVTRAIRSALQRIAAADPELAQHLSVTVRTGTVCVYTPDPRAAIRWKA